MWCKIGTQLYSSQIGTYASTTLDAVQSVFSPVIELPSSSFILVYNSFYDFKKRIGGSMPLILVIILCPAW